MLKFKSLYIDSGEVYTSTAISEIFCNANTEEDIYLSLVSAETGEVIDLDCELDSIRIDGIEVEGHIGTWYSIDYLYNSEDGFLMLVEHEEYGDETAHLIIDLNGRVVLDDVWNGFDDYEEYIDSQTIPQF